MGAGDEIIAVNDIEVTEVENAVEDLREALKGELGFYLAIFFSLIMNFFYCYVN